MTVTFSVVETKSLSIRSLLAASQSTQRILSGDNVEIAGNRVMLDGEHVASITDHGQVFMMVSQPVVYYNKMAITG